MIYVRTNQLIAARAYAKAKAAYEADPNGKTGRAMADAQEALDIVTEYQSATRQYVEAIVAGEPQYTKLTGTVLLLGTGEYSYHYEVHGYHPDDPDLERVLLADTSAGHSQGDALVYISNAIKHYGVDVAEIRVLNGQG